MVYFLHDIFMGAIYFLHMWKTSTEETQPVFIHPPLTHFPKSINHYSTFRWTFKDEFMNENMWSLSFWIWLTLNGNISSSTSMLPDMRGFHSSSYFSNIHCVQATCFLYQFIPWWSSSIVKITMYMIRWVFYLFSEFISFLPVLYVGYDLAVWFFLILS
jgi:hypothetical protein